ncbi:MAG: hypothetical protein GY760_18860 [Deltaproteobacteria bacterium]|nr:hypothetical protein [Deltaproteobacteria bacterium]
MDIKDYQELTTGYKKTVVSRYIAIEKDKILTNITSDEKYLVSTKYDGHYFSLCCIKGEPFLINRSGRIYDDLPILKNAKELFKTKKIKNIAIPGEIYYNDEGRVRAFHTTKALAESSEHLKFAAFDIIQPEDSPYKNSLETFEELKTIFPAEGTLHYLDAKVVESRNEIKEIFINKVEEGGEEGVIVKPSQGFTYKIKPKHTFDAVVVGYAEGDGDREGLVRDLLLAFMREDNTYQIFGHLHHGFTDDERRELLKELESERIESNYIEVARNKVAFQMIKPERVIEFSTIDLISESATSVIRKTCLKYEDGKLIIDSVMPSVSCSVPQFIKFRDDKKAVYEDVRFSQIDDFIEVPKEGAVKDLPESTIIKREVYVKESKGKKMVRKFLLWKTNKEEQQEFPAYVFFYTDFSPNRKDLLKKNIIVSDSEEQIGKIFQDSVKDNVKKGWESV